MVHCGVVKSDLLLAICPLPIRSCQWQHSDGSCCFQRKKELEGLSDLDKIAKYCSIVGIPTPTEAQYKETLDLIKKELVNKGNT